MMTAYIQDNTGQVLGYMRPLSHTCDHAIFLCIVNKGLPSLPTTYTKKVEAG